MRAPGERHRVVDYRRLAAADVSNISLEGGDASGESPDVPGARSWRRLRAAAAAGAALFGVLQPHLPHCWKRGSWHDAWRQPAMNRPAACAAACFTVRSPHVAPQTRTTQLCADALGLGTDFRALHAELLSYGGYRAAAVRRVQPAQLTPDWLQHNGAFRYCSDALWCAGVLVCWLPAHQPAQPCGRTAAHRFPFSRTVICVQARAGICRAWRRTSSGHRAAGGLLDCGPLGIEDRAAV